MAHPGPPRPPAITWDGTAALLGAAYAVPAALVALDDVSRGVAFALGATPPAIIGLAPRRRGRLAVVLVGVVTGLSMFLGALLSGVPVLAVVAIGLLGMGATLLARRWPAGRVAMTLSLPLVGVGLSYTDLGTGAALAALMIGGALYACAVSMLWPERPAAPRRPSPPDRERPTLGYGIRLGAAGASAAAIGFLLDLDHVGWACAACLLVMRPAAEMQRVRSVGRVLAVAAGALVAIVLLRLDPANGWYAAAVVVVLAGAAATHRSRWYVTSAFTTFLVFLMLLYASPGDAQARFDERIGETILGVGIAYLFGLLIPSLTADRDEAPR